MATPKPRRPSPTIPHRPTGRGAKSAVRSRTAEGPVGSPNRTSRGNNIFTSMWKTPVVLQVSVLTYIVGGVKKAFTALCSPISHCSTVQTAYQNKTRQNGMLRAALSLLNAVGLSDLAVFAPEVALRSLDIAYEMRRRIDKEYCALLPFSKEGFEFGEKDCRIILTLWSCLDFCSTPERNRIFELSLWRPRYDEISIISAAYAVRVVAVRAVCRIRRYCAVRHLSAATLRVPHAVLLSLRHSEHLVWWHRAGASRCVAVNFVH